MKRSLLAILGLTLTSLVIGCSGGGSGGGAKKDNKAGGAMPAGAIRPTTMTDTKWCFNGQDGQGNPAQQRIGMSDSGRYILQNFYLDATGARAQEFLKEEGEWYVLTNKLVYKPDGGQEQNLDLRLDPNGPAGQKQMILNGTAFDPCN